MGRLTWIAVFVMMGSFAAHADLPSVVLGKALAAAEHAHTTHDLAKQSCSVRDSKSGGIVDIGWDSVEKRIKKLANSGAQVKASKMIMLLDVLRGERQALFRDFVGCYSNLSSNEAIVISISDAMRNLDDAARDVEGSIMDMVLGLESSVDWERQHQQHTP